MLNLYTYFLEDYWETSAGKNVLSFNLALYILTDIYTFASRLARSNAFDSGLSLGIELSNMKNRYLAEIYPGAIIADRFPILNYKCNISKIQLRRDLSLPEIFGNPIELAIADTLQILNKFGLSSRLIEEKLIDEQGKLFRRMYVPISIDDPVRNKQIFRDRLMEELCRKYNNLSRNTLTKDFIFNIEDIRKEAMEGFLRPYWDQMLPELQNEEDLIQILPGGKIRLTKKGIMHCKARHSRLY